MPTPDSLLLHASRSCSARLLRLGSSLFSSLTGASGSGQREGQRDFQAEPDPKAAPLQRQQQAGGPSLASRGRPCLRQHFSPSLLAPGANQGLACLKHEAAFTAGSVGQPMPHLTSPITQKPSLGFPTCQRPAPSLGRAGVCMPRERWAGGSALPYDSPSLPPCPPILEKMAHGDRRGPERQQSTYVSSR